MESGANIGIRPMRENDLPWAPEDENKCYPGLQVTEYIQSEIEF